MESDHTSNPKIVPHMSAYFAYFCYIYCHQFSDSIESIPRDQIEIVCRYETPFPKAEKCKMRTRLSIIESLPTEKRTHDLFLFSSATSSNSIESIFVHLIEYIGHSRNDGDKMMTKKFRNFLHLFIEA